jgi:hypothetical protein
MIGATIESLTCYITQAPKFSQLHIVRGLQQFISLQDGFDEQEQHDLLFRASKIRKSPIFNLLDF